VTRTTYEYVRKRDKEKKSLFPSLKSVYGLYGFLAFILLGILYGSIRFGGLNADIFSRLSAVFGSHTNMLETTGIMRLFFNSISQSLWIILIIFVLGFCAIGYPIIAALCFIQGIAFGLSASYVYALMGASGILYSLALMIPGTLMHFLIVINASKSAGHLSLRILSVVTNKSKQEDLHHKCWMYCVHFFIYILLLLIKALIESILITIFSGFF